MMRGHSAVRLKRVDEIDYSTAVPRRRAPKTEVRPRTEWEPGRRFDTVESDVLVRLAAGLLVALEALFDEGEELVGAVEEGKDVDEDAEEVLPDALLLLGVPPEEVLWEIWSAEGVLALDLGATTHSWF